MTGASRKQVVHHSAHVSCMNEARAVFLLSECLYSETFPVAGSSA